MNRLNYICISFSSRERASRRMNKSSINVKTITACTETKAIIKRDKYLKDINADLNNFRWFLDY